MTKSSSSSSSSNCQDAELIQLLKEHFSSNDTVWQLVFDEQRSCPDDQAVPPWDPFVNASGGAHHSRRTTDGVGGGRGVGVGGDAADYRSGSEAFYAFVTPFVIVVGLAGNLVSLKVFSTPQLRKLSSSHYLTAISLSDSLVLVTYVFLDWLNRGLPLWPGGHRVQIVNVSGACQAFLFASYAFRFISVWLIVLFTVERYIAVCRPFYSRLTCTKAFARRAIWAVVVLAALVSLYKPVLSGVYDTAGPRVQPNSNVHQITSTSSYFDFVGPENKSSSSTAAGSAGAREAPWVTSDILLTYQSAGERACRGNPDYDGSYLNFVMDVAYGLLITAVPFVPIAVLNTSILRALINRDRNIRKLNLMVAEKKVRLEFTVNLLAVSASFLGLNVPYFVFWCQQFVQSLYADDDISVVLWNRDKLLFAKVVFYFNYAINFFLYSLTGAYYRSSLGRLFSCAKSKTTAFPMRNISLSNTFTQYSSVKAAKYGTDV